MDVLIATRNPGKIKTALILLNGVGVKGIALKDAGISPIYVVENGQTPEENALLKATAYYRYTGRTVLASDTGVEIDALGGLPGVMVRRWNGQLPDDIGDEEWLEFFLDQTKQIPESERTGKFVTAWSVIHQGRSYTHHIVRTFRFAARKVRPISPGFPMSAIVNAPRQDSVEQVYVPAFREWVKREEIFI
ncbi:non-canonical purine NTP pyrophosphatase [Paenactinomyces guangxiensis]|uniref:Non-canonical purine NTP pyrophosphatase n=1 Tax=Paenactinomyces guangxiensis TaxID=1490290 RepID=A0A7W1WRJ2_9BACL|nr:non-canonical purine NTP pyrophosphatase [Paenactinomyces guangxiensis]MBA4494730.1 hypothetical protein [Paenactinomyces guangxiensis]MBH8591814.1 hypothetical protein [Paenactinomyces guangxiensis]